MKLTILSGLLLVLGIAQSIPQDNGEPHPEPENLLNEMLTQIMAEDDMDLDLKQAPSPEFKKEMQKVIDSHPLKLTRMQDTEENNQDFKMEPEYKEEMKEETAQNPAENKPDQDEVIAEGMIEEVGQSQGSEVEAQQGNKCLYSGFNVGLQTYDQFNWLGCAGNPCGRATCPRMLMMGSDFSRCWGEVFRIYRVYGAGPVRVGDFVGIYYPRENSWVGCPGNLCGKSRCPGTPNIRYGFQACYKWLHCWGEVFRIYVRGKAHGAIINSGDHVAFYYQAGGLWLAQGPGRADRRPCLGRALPPPLHQYDGCAYETFRLWVQ